MADKPKRSTWTNQMAFVLAAAASAIGLGNLWRFPYLAAQYGGGTFILVYLILVVTLGFTLMTTEIAIGRKTQQSQLTAYSKLHKGYGFIGLLGTIIPILIVPYYCVIGGWVVKYFCAYFKWVVAGAGPEANPFMIEGVMNPDAFFGGFVTAPFAPFGYGLLFILICAAVIVLGVKNGIEKSNAVLMPMLFFFAIGISVYVCCLPGSGAGLKYYLVPNLDGFREANGTFSLALLGKTVLGAMGQMFYSLSLAMGIMITYGSYVRKEDSIEKSVRRIEIFDTIIAIIAGLMIIPVVYMFAVKNPKPVTAAELENAGGNAEIVREIVISNIESKVYTENEIAQLAKNKSSVEQAVAEAKENWKSQPIEIAQLEKAAEGNAEGDAALNLEKGSALSIKKSMNGGTGLMFKTLPRVFADFGKVGAWIGMVFFMLVIFAALTSAISLYEACVASICDLLDMKRKNATFFMFFVIAFLAVFSALGYGTWGDVTLFGQPFLDFFDFVTNSALMPIVAVLTCFFVGWVIKPKAIEDEILLGEKKFAARGLYNVMVKYIAPILIIAILISEICRYFAIGGWSI